MAAANGVATEEKGYFATLGLDFRSDSDAISRAYKKLALKMHPDKNPVCGLPVPIRGARIYLPHRAAGTRMRRPPPHVVALAIRRVQQRSTISRRSRRLTM